MNCELHVVVLTRAVAPLHGAGGLERHVHDLVRHLSRRDVRVTLVTRPADTDAPAMPFNPERVTLCTVPYVTFPLAGRRWTTVADRSTAYPLFGWRAGRLAASLVRKGGVQLVYGLGASVLGYARERQRDRLGTVPLVFNPQGLEEFGATDPSRAGLKRVAYRPLQAAVRACARAADRVIATDQTLLPTVLAHLGTDPARVRVVPNAIDVEDIDRLADAGRAAAHRRALGLEPDDVLIVSVGRLEENKGFATLIEALASLHAGPAPLGERWKLVLVGDGPFRGALERQVAAAGLQDRVRMPGRVSDADLQAWYDAATLFVHPTLYEGSSLVTLEAMAHRRAVVATQSGGLPDKVRPGVNGWLVAPGDAGALASALRDALSDRSRLGFMGLASRAIVCREFDWSVVTGRFLSVCDEVIRGRSSDA